MTKCKTKKRRFRDELSAKIMLSKLKWMDKGHSRVYHCKLCGGFHLTSQEQRTGKASQ